MPTEAEKEAYNKKWARDMGRTALIGGAGMSVLFLTIIFSSCSTKPNTTAPRALDNDKQSQVSPESSRSASQLTSSNTVGKPDILLT